MNPTFKRYLISSLVTFLTAFFGVLALELKAGIPMDLTVPLIIGITGVAARAGFKAVVEWLAGALSTPTEA